MEILKEIAEASTFQVECFDGKLLIEGRILTAPEIEQIGQVLLFWLRRF